MFRQRSWHYFLVASSNPHNSTDVVTHLGFYLCYHSYTHCSVLMDIREEQKVLYVIQYGSLWLTVSGVQQPSVG